MTVSAPAPADGMTELLHRPQGADDITVSLTNETVSGRVYCQEHDCGRGFSSEAHLESHMRFFHSKQPKQIVEFWKGVSPSPNGVVGRSAGQPPEDHPSTSTVTHPYVGERVTWGDRDLRPSVGARVPNLQVGGCQGVDPMAENAGRRSEIPTGPPPSTQGGANTQPKTESPTTNIHPLCCRMCEAPPTVTTQPTVTTCGHLFCSECITQHVVSASRCPVCNSCLLLYCLFKLDLPVTS